MFNIRDRIEEERRDKRARLDKAKESFKKLLEDAHVNLR